MLIIVLFTPTAGAPNFTPNTILLPLPIMKNIHADLINLNKTEGLCHNLAHNL